MQKVLPKAYTKTKVTEGVISTLAFFDLYKLPLPAQRVWELLYRAEATLSEVELELDRLASSGLIARKNGLYALSDWDESRHLVNQMEIDKRWTIVKKYFWALSSVPFVEHIAVINSVAMGNADSESDIDFFVITKPNRLYFARTWIILLFKLMGVYKNRRVTNERFCFGFYITSDNLSIKELLLAGEDPYLTYWLGTITPITGQNIFERFIKENKWIYSWLPNYRTQFRLETIRNLKPSAFLQKCFSLLFALPAAISEPFLRWYHIRHTFKLPENHWATSSTIANKHMLKLHAIDPRKDIRNKYQNVLNQYK